MDGDDEGEDEQRMDWDEGGDEFQTLMQSVESKEQSVRFHTWKIADLRARIENLKMIEGAESLIEDLAGEIGDEEESRRYFQRQIIYELRRACQIGWARLHGTFTDRARRGLH